MRAREAGILFGGGTTLGCYHLGVVEALHRQLNLRLVGSCSIGAVTAAILADNPLKRGVERLRDFWDLAAGRYLDWVRQSHSSLASSAKS